MFKYTKAFSSFSVDDLQKAKDFYSKTLGLKVIDRNGLLELKTGGDNMVLVYPKPDHTAASFTILNFVVEKIDKAVEELTALGVRFEQYGGDIKTDEKGISRSEMNNIAWFKDPAGNILSVLEDKRKDTHGDK